MRLPLTYSSSTCHACPLITRYCLTCHLSSRFNIQGTQRPQSLIKPSTIFANLRFSASIETTEQYLVVLVSVGSFSSFNLHHALGTDSIFSPPPLQGTLAKSVPGTSFNSECNCTAQTNLTNFRTRARHRVPYLFRYHILVPSWDLCLSVSVPATEPCIHSACAWTRRGKGLKEETGNTPTVASVPFPCGVSSPPLSPSFS